jgi:thiamine pyrophosphokinase
LVGGGNLLASDLDLALSLGPDLIAADSGADAALAHGCMPRLVVGDLDSVSDHALAQIPETAIVEVREQETTDFDKALRIISAPVVLAVGFLGGRMDHQLAAMNVLVRYSGSPCILIGDTDLAFAVPRSFDLKIAAGEPMSLFPMTRVSGRSVGLQWPIDGLVLAPDGRIATSNLATGPVSLRLDRTGLVGFVPRSALNDLIAALSG